MRTSGAHAEQHEHRQATRGPAPARQETSGSPAVPPPLTADGLRAAQRGAGNAAVTAMIARRARPAPVTEQPDHGVDQVLGSAGKPLAAPVRQDMESRFGTDFSDVRLHTGAAATRSARAIGARAYTSGSHVVLGAGGRDKHTLAHELTHVVQQRNGPVSGTDHGNGLKISDPSDKFERAAEANAHKVMSGPVPDVQRAPEAAGHKAGAAGAGMAEADMVQRASSTTLENATVTHYQPTKPGAQHAQNLPIQRPKTVTGPVIPTATSGRGQAPNPIAVKKLHTAYKNAKGKRGAPSEADVWKDLFGGAGYDRGHVMGLEVGGSDKTENIVPQWSLNQGTGMWRKIEQALVGVGTGNLTFEVIYETNTGNHRHVMTPIRIDIYLDSHSTTTTYREWTNEPDVNDLMRAGRDPSDAADFYTETKQALGANPTLTEKQMQEFARSAIAQDKATFLAYKDYEDGSAAGQTPATSSAAAHAQGMTFSDISKDRRDKLIESYIAAGWVTKSGSKDTAIYTLNDVPAPAPDSDTESSGSSSESDAEMADDFQPPAPGQPFASMQFDSQGSGTDSDYEDKMSTGA
ncbi:eCIS core domain-containing protein [Streptomyces sp. NBC_00459]|uniref:eCIS core domain-containing protein n=1 Tax=Streptomyces sp. NBC_00459 TaxID=2975749 RepID=UPI002E170FC1